ncbi:hypothetical protein N7448_011250 [Penicillium atrosanguineum]|nr:hypothetical protein N7448_011250 [Penicillium atrosanguineum]
MRALEHSSIKVLLLLMKAPWVDINLQNQAWESALWYAIKYGTSRTVLKIAVACPGIKLDLRHKRGRTALHRAVWAGRIGLVQVLLSQGSDPNAKDDSGYSPWDWACHNDKPFMKTIFSTTPNSGCLFDIDPVYHDQRPLHQAVAHGSTDAVRQLLGKNDVDLRAHDRNGNTPLHLAVRTRSREVVALLLDHPQVRINCRDKHGNTPLWLATQMSTHLSFDAVAERLLEERGVDINFVGGYDESQVPSSSLHHAVLKPDTVALQRLLAVPGIELGLFAAGQSPFGLACAHGRVEAMKVLLNTGRVDINTSEFGDPPIFQAVERGQLEAVRLLVQQGGRLQINRKTMMAHDTALCIAARDGSSEIARALLRHDQINPNLENQLLQAPLALAAQGAHLRVVDALLADPRLSPCGLTRALDFASSDSVRRVIQRKIDDFGTPVSGPAQSSQQRTSTFLNCKY